MTTTPVHCTAITIVSIATELWCVLLISADMRYKFDECGREQQAVVLGWPQYLAKLWEEEANLTSSTCRGV